MVERIGNLWKTSLQWLSKEAAVSMCLAIIFRWIAIGLSWFLCSTAMPMQALMLAVVRPYRVFAIRSLTWNEWSCPQLLLLWGLSDSSITELCERPRCFSIKLHSETQVFDSLGMSGLNSQKMPGTPYRAIERKHETRIIHQTLLISPHPHVIICTSVLSSMDCTVKMSLKWLLVPRSDVKGTPWDETFLMLSILKI